MIYLDNNATTCPLPEAVKAMQAVLVDDYGNPSSVHGAGERARRHVESARAEVAALLGARPTEIVFTSGATESTNAALRGAIAAARTNTCRIVTTAVEHEATIEVCRHLREQGVRVEIVPVLEDGRLNLGAYERALAEPTTLVSFMAANNETGVFFPLEAMVAKAKAAGAQVHVDAVQIVGKLPIDVEALGVDFVSLSGHKFYAPKGVGALYVRRGARFKPLLFGAPHEGGRRAGTENVPGIVGLGVAARHVRQGIDARRARLGALSARIEARLLALPGTRLNGAKDGRVPGVANLSFRDIEGSAIVITVARDGVCISAGSACSAAQFGGSHVLEAMGVPFEYLHGAIRVSCAESTTEAEVDAACDRIEAAVRYLRSMIPGAPSPRS